MARIPQLDGLRAIAVMLVVFAHTLTATALNQFGQSGVRLFFVLSGYLITRILLNQQCQPLGTTLRTFYIRRTLRIFPLYYLALFVAYLVAYDALMRSWPWMLTYTSNIELLFKPAWNQGALSHFWSLAVEEQFYLIWPLLILAIPRHYTVTVILSAIYLSVLLRTFNTWLGWYSIWFQTPAQFDALGMGALLAYLHHQKLPSYCDMRLLLKLLFLALFLKAIKCMPFESLSEAVFHAALVDFTLNPKHQRWIALLRTRPFQFIGKLSYGIYVWHAIIAHQTFTSYGISKFLFVLSTTLLVAWFSWVLIEKPINDLRLRFEYGK